MNELQNDLHELFLDQLADLLDAETQLTKALPKLAETADSPELETEGHVGRLEQVFKALRESPERKTCKAMQGLVEDEEIMEGQAESSAFGGRLDRGRSKNGALRDRIVWDCV